MDYAALINAIQGQYSPASDPFFGLGQSILKQPEPAPLTGNRSFWGGFIPTATQGFLGGTALGYGKASAEGKQKSALQELVDYSGSDNKDEFLKDSKYLSKIPAVGVLKLADDQARADEERKTRLEMAQKGFEQGLFSSPEEAIAWATNKKPIAKPAFPTEAPADQYQTPADPAAAAAMAGGGDAITPSAVARRAAMYGLSPSDAAGAKTFADVEALVKGREFNRKTELKAAPVSLTNQIDAKEQVLSHFDELTNLLDEAAAAGRNGLERTTAASFFPSSPEYRYKKTLQLVADSLNSAFKGSRQYAAIKNTMDALALTPIADMEQQKTLLNQVKSLALSDAQQMINRHSGNYDLSGYGSLLDRNISDVAQTKTVGGVTYKKVPGGWVPQ